MTVTTLAIDCMGGDIGPPVMVQAVCLALNKYPHLNVLLVGDTDQINAQLCAMDRLIAGRIVVIPAKQVVTMEDRPSQAVRQKTESSMAIAMSLVAEGKAQGVVSAGNTGALMAFARKILKMIPGISRPAIISAVPTERRVSRLIDLGANVDCSPEQLSQFALMGSALVKAINNSSSLPKVALLNLGSEEAKGNKQTRQTHELLQNISNLNYTGFIEGDQIYKGDIDIIVTDGFVGNVLIKASEGVARMMVQRIDKEFKRSLWTRFLAAGAISVLKSLHKGVNPDQYNGASFVGLEGVVVKSHGAANVTATVAAIEEALREAENDIPRKIKQQLLEQLQLS